MNAEFRETQTIRDLESFIGRPLIDSTETPDAVRIPEQLVDKIRRDFTPDTNPTVLEVDRTLHKGDLTLSEAPVHSMGSYMKGHSHNVDTINRTGAVVANPDDPTEIGVAAPGISANDIVSLHRGTAVGRLMVTQDPHEYKNPDGTQKPTITDEKNVTLLLNTADAGPLPTANPWANSRRQEVLGLIQDSAFQADPT